MLDVILLITTITSLLGILYIVLSKFPQLATIRLDIIPAEQQIEMRNKIIANRLKGKIGNQKDRLIKTIRPFWLNFTSFFWKIYSKILEKERHLQQMAMTPQEKEAAKTKVNELLKKASAACRDNLFMRAERIYINIISLDPKNLGAYDGLAQMYWQQKDYQKVKETLKFLLNLGKQKRDVLLDKKMDSSDIDIKLVQYYLKLGELYQYQGNNDGAWQQFYEAIQIDENNPKALDQLLEISIILKKIDTARDVLLKMKKIDPDNQKIEEWERRIDEFE